MTLIELWRELNQLLNKGVDHDLEVHTTNGTVDTVMIAGYDNDKGSEQWILLLDDGPRGEY